MSNQHSFGAFSWMKPSVQPQRQRSQSPSRHPRKSLEGYFENLSISRSTSPPKSPNRKRLPAALMPRLTTFSKAFGMNPTKAVDVKFTIRTSANYREYATDDDPEILFKEISQIMIDLREQMKLDDLETFEEALTDSMMNAIFSSNNIERVGLGLDETWKICLCIFRGDDMKADDIDERSLEYQKSIDNLLKQHGKGFANKAWVIRSRREVIQHAKAMEYMTRAIVINNEPLSEILILDTHRILTEGIDNYHADRSFTPYKKYGGIYRKVFVGAGNTNFAFPPAIPKLMREMVEEFNLDIAEAESKGELDPFFLAAKYSNEFVQIHPFEDGNGRMSRLILNTILIKYAGIVVSIGEHDNARAEYIGIMARSGKEMWGGGELASLVMKKAATTLRGWKEKMNAGRMK